MNTKLIEAHRHARTDERDRIASSERIIATHLEGLLASQDPVSLLTSLASNGDSIITFSCAIDDRPRARRGLRVCADAVTALFRLAAHPNVATSFTIEDRAYTVTVGPHGMAGPPEWRNGFSAACALRHSAALTELVGASDDTLNASSMSAAWDASAYPHIHALQSLTRREHEAGAQLRAARELAAANNRDAHYRDLIVAEIDLATALHEADAARFNAALERALVAHRTYWTQPPGPNDIVRNRPEYPDGFVALLPLALACLAHDRGIAVDVESAYIPSWIVRREWSG